MNSKTLIDNAREWDCPTEIGLLSINRQGFPFKKSWKHYLLARRTEKTLEIKASG